MCGNVEKKAVVLSGGGAKGAYQAGVWKALRKLHYHYKIVTGTSVGALNGVLMVQRDYYKCLKMWENMDFEKIFIDHFPDKIDGISGKAGIYKRYAASFLKNGGINTSRFEQMVYKMFSSFRFFRSSIDFGLVVYNFTTRKPLEITKAQMTEKSAPLYIIGSASCFPAFPMKKIDGNQYIDGGYSDNMPINLAISLGATEIVAVDLHAVGKKKKVTNTDVKITMVEPKNQIVSFLIFEKQSSRKAICYGYNDTMKAFHKLEGNMYTFRLGELKKQYQKFEIPLQKALEKRLLNKKQFVEEKLLKRSIFQKLLEDQTGTKREKQFYEIIELIGKNLKLDDSKIYKMRDFSKAALYKLSIIDHIDLKTIERRIMDGKLRTLFGTSTILKFLYDKIEKPSKKKKSEYCKYALLFPKEFMAATYLYVLNLEYQIV